MSASAGLSIAVVGYGKMGHAIEEAARRRGHRVSLRIDPLGGDVRGVDEIDDAAASKIDIALEFSAPETAAGNVKALLERGLPVVCGSTGWDAALDEARALAREREVGFLWAPNFALGVQLTFRIVQAAAKQLGALSGFSPFLVEEHHDAKRDAPSGTARRLAEILVKETPGKRRYAAAPAKEPISADCVPVAWVRAGAIPGTHRVGWDGPGETLEITHRVRDRGVFAAGAVHAAEWTVTERGPRTIDDMLDAVLSGPRDH